MKVWPQPDDKDLSTAEIVFVSALVGLPFLLLLWSIVRAVLLEVRLLLELLL